MLLYATLYLAAALVLGSWGCVVSFNIFVFSLSIFLSVVVCVCFCYNIAIIYAWLVSFCVFVILVVRRHAFLATGCWLVPCIVSYNCPLLFHREKQRAKEGESMWKCACVCMCVLVWAEPYALQPCVDMVVAWWWLFASHTPTADAVRLFVFVSHSVASMYVCPNVCLFARSFARSLVWLLVVCTLLSK